MDIDGDGIKDITSGEYGGKITCYKGAKDGFHGPFELEEELVKNMRYTCFYDFLFTNPTFSDYNGDGLHDAFLGGAKGMIYMLNVGTKDKPKFGKRVPILDLNGNQILIRDLTPEEKEKFLNPKERMKTTHFKSYVHHIDWDNDGIKDIIATSSYSGDVDAVLFYKGVETPDGVRFAERVPLFKAKCGGKIFPPSAITPYFHDINGDGALDLILGVRYRYCKETNEVLYEPSRPGKCYFKGHVIVMLSKKHYR